MNKDTDVKDGLPVGDGLSGTGKLIVLVQLVIVVGLLASMIRQQLSIAYLAEQEVAIRAYQSDHPVLIYAIALLIYAAVTGLSLPGAAVMSLVYGWFFGFWPALVVVSFGSTSGATLAFLLSRYFLRGAIQQKFGGRLAGFNEALRREGAFYLFTLRLIPMVPFFVINAVMGLTPIRVWTFWWVSQIGMLAGTCVYVFAGSTLPSLDQFDSSQSILTPQLAAAFILLGIFPLAVKKMMGWVRPKRDGEGGNVGNDE